MAYSTPKQFIERSGLGTLIIDENVGTGTGALADFDLDNDKIVSGTFTLSVAVSGSNTFTPLVDVTDFALDLDSGRIILTASGIAALGTDILFASYYFATEQITDSMINQYIDTADDEIDLITGRKWDAPQNRIEHRDGKRRSFYPTTDRPFESDFDAPDVIMLDKHPVRKIDNVFFLSRPNVIQRVFNFDDSSSTFTDFTDNANESESALFTPFASPPDVSDIIYIGMQERFLSLEVNLQVLGTGSPVIVWEFWNGSTWAALTITEVESGSSTFTADGRFNWNFPFGWAKVAVNVQNLFWIRGRVTTIYSVPPQIATLAVHDSIDKVIEPRSIAFESYGELNIIDSIIPNGTQNVRIDYRFGEDTAPTFITELSVLMSSIKGF